MLTLIKNSLMCSHAKGFCSVLLLSVVYTNSSASISYEQAPLNRGDAVFANASSGAISADNFSVTNPFKLESISWWGSYDTADSDNFIIHLHSDASGFPGTMNKEYSAVAVTSTLTALNDISAASVYRYDYVLPNVLSLTSGNYYLSITNETTSSGWYWLTGTGGDTKQWALDSNGTTWSLASNSDFAFAVQYTEISAVPLPSAFLLMLSGVLGLAWKRLFS